MSDPQKTVFAFPSIHHSLEGEDIFTKAGIDFDFMQIPSSAGLSCGTGLAVAGEKGDEAKGLLLKNRVPLAGVYFVFPDGGWEKTRRFF